jgi:TM2 domain-containing membrane protein YozV/ribosomal protein L40E
MPTDNAKISFSCPGCSRSLKASPLLAGKMVKCPCGTKFKAEESDASGTEKTAATPKPQDTSQSLNLTTCQDCNAKISRRAQTCPKCGSPTGTGDSMDFGGLSMHQAAPVMAAPPFMQLAAQQASNVPARPGQKFCSSCGAPHNANQAICLKCGVAIKGGAGGGTSNGNKTKATAGVLALLLGGLGIHHFYHGSWGRGLLFILMLLFGIGFIVNPILALIEAIIIFSMSEEKYNLKYNETPPAPFK